MNGEPYIAEVAALIGDPARANMLLSLMDGRALTASELAALAGVTAQTASGHLAKLLAARLVALERQGRHRYYRLHDRRVATALEALSVLGAGSGRQPPRPGPRDAAMRFARTCYDHLAGRLGVALADGLIARGYLMTPGDGGALDLTESGRSALAALEIDVAAWRGRRRPAVRRCLDWSERRTHLSGALGAALLDLCERRRWIRRLPDCRAVTVTPEGLGGLQEHFAVRLERDQERPPA